MRNILLGLFVILLISCEKYNPAGINRVYVDSIAITSVPVIHINNYDDTITMVPNPTIKFTTDINGNDIKRIEITADGYNYNQTIEDNFESGAISLGDIYQQGYYPLTFRVFFDSKTHSLADNLGAEVYYIDYIWTMHYLPMENGRKWSVFITARQTDDKVLISWQRYNFTDFSYYVLTKEAPFTGIVWSKRITDYKSTSVLDDLPETGTGHNYYLKIYRKDGTHIQDVCYFYL
jgi:hypothetical protein